MELNAMITTAFGICIGIISYFLKMTIDRIKTTEGDLQNVKAEHARIERELAIVKNDQSHYLRTIDEIKTDLKQILNKLNNLPSERA
jgi:hypothetical protein